jgi:hypothetical protein
MGHGGGGSNPDANRALEAQRQSWIAELGERSELAPAIYDIDVTVGGEQGSFAVVVCFSHVAFSALRFAYRCEAPGADRYEIVWFREELATGALQRMMDYDSPQPAPDGLIWTQLYGALLGWVGERDTTRLTLRAFAHVGASPGGQTCGIYVPASFSPSPCGRPSIARAPYSLWRTESCSETGSRAVGACSDHLEELQRRVTLKGGQVEILDRARRSGQDKRSK